MCFCLGTDTSLLLPPSAAPTSFSLGTPCFAHLTASLLPRLSYGRLLYERSAAAGHVHADKRLKVTEKKKDNANQFSKLGID